MIASRWLPSLFKESEVEETLPSELLEWRREKEVFAGGRESPAYPEEGPCQGK
jgi:hypothetical protein